MKWDGEPGPRGRDRKGRRRGSLLPSGGEKVVDVHGEEEGWEGARENIKIWSVICFENLEPMSHSQEPFTASTVVLRLSQVAQSVENCLQYRRPRFDPWVGKIPCKKPWQPTPVFLPGESQGQRSLVGDSQWGRRELDMTEAAAHAGAHMIGAQQSPRDLCDLTLPASSVSSSFPSCSLSLLQAHCLCLVPSCFWLWLSVWNVPILAMGIAGYVSAFRFYVYILCLSQLE